MLTNFENAILKILIWAHDNLVKSIPNTYLIKVKAFERQTNIPEESFVNTSIQNFDQVWVDGQMSSCFFNVVVLDFLFSAKVKGVSSVQCPAWGPLIIWLKPESEAFLKTAYPTSYQCVTVPKMLDDTDTDTFFWN